MSTDWRISMEEFLTDPRAAIERAKRFDGYLVIEAAGEAVLVMQQAKHFFAEFERLMTLERANGTLCPTLAKLYEAEERAVTDGTLKKIR